MDNDISSMNDGIGKPFFNGYNAAAVSPSIFAIHVAIELPSELLFDNIDEIIGRYTVKAPNPIAYPDTFATISVTALTAGDDAITEKSKNFDFILPIFSSFLTSLEQNNS